MWLFEQRPINKITRNPVRTVENRLLYDRLYRLCPPTVTILGCMWVYTYKTDKYGCFVKCKARLMVKDDQQIILHSQETYAATLAGRSF
jgi:hypothetical protein